MYILQITSYNRSIFISKYIYINSICSGSRSRSKNLYTLVFDLNLYIVELFAQLMEPLLLETVRREGTENCSFSNFFGRPSIQISAKGSWIQFLI
jgi:hypothetical protein